LKELAGGYAFGMIGWCVGATTAKLVSGNDAAVPIVGYSVYGLGASIGVWLTGEQYDGGKYMDTFVGTASFPLLVTGIAALLGTRLNASNELVWFSLPIGAFIGYNLSLIWD
jgi:hypothetical protein